MAYHGGPVAGRLNVYYIFYGDFSGSTTPDILADFTSNIGSSPYFNILSTYGSGNQTPIDTRLQYGGSVFVQPGDPAWRGTSLQSNVADPANDDLYQILQQEIAGGALPLDTVAYFFITGHDISLPDFCTVYMGWHWWASIDNTPFIYGMAGSPLHCGGVPDCYQTSPNDNPEADELANIMAHELAESYTDAEGNAWYDTNSGGTEEIGDKCAWNYGQVTQLPNGSFANVNLGDRAYLLQQLWVNDGSGFCGMWWKPSLDAGSTYVIHARAHGGSCMDVRASGTANGTQIQEWTCNGTGAQSFRLEDAGNGAFYVVDTNANKCVDVQGRGTANGTKIQLYDCNGTSAQTFVAQDANYGFVTFVNTNSNKCLDVRADNPNDGTVVQLYDCNGTAAQQWVVTPVGS
jgi:hypothetical protein